MNGTTRRWATACLAACGLALLASTGRAADYPPGGGVQRASGVNQEKAPAPRPAATAPVTVVAPTPEPLVIGPGQTTAPVPPPRQPVAPPPAPATVVPAGVPVGTVMGWLKNLQNTPALPPDWAECNGQTVVLPDSPYNGVALPDLNAATQAPGRYLRGSVQSGDIGGAESHRHGGFLSNRNGPRVINVSAWTIADNNPPYYTVVWIIKVR